MVVQVLPLPQSNIVRRSRQHFALNQLVSSSVSYSRAVFVLLWVVFLLVHGLAIAYYSMSAVIYRALPTTMISTTLSFYSVWSYQRMCSTIAVVQAVFAAVHLGCICHACRQFVQWRRRTPSGPLSVNVGPRIDAARQPQRTHAMMRALSVQGEYFELMHLSQETIEIALQSIQGYRLSRWVARRGLMMAFTVLLMLNCWATPLASRLHASEPLRARFWSILVDTVLDVVVAIGLPITLAFPYLEKYDASQHDIDWTVWYEDKWMVRVLNEFQLILIGSTWDFLNSVLFSTTTIVGLVGMEKMLTLATTANCSDPPVHTTSRDHNRHRVVTASRHGVERGLRLLITLWGVVLLVVLLIAHVYDTGAAVCAVQVFPWLHKGGCSCALAEVNCNKLVIDGRKQDLTLLLQPLEPTFLTHLVLRHCAFLEFPPIFQTFSNLTLVKIHNSSVSRWDDTAAITAAHHPGLLMAYFVDVNFTEFPRGLQHPEFPSQLADIEFSGTNLTGIPDSAVQSWPRDMIFAMERSPLASVPTAVLRLNVSYLSLCGNQLQALPLELFTHDSALTAWLSLNPFLTTLPDSTTPLDNNLWRIKLTQSNVTILPQWIDADYFARGGQLSLGGSPYCNRLLMADEELFEVFIVSANASGAIDCSVTEGDDLFFYPYEFERQQSPVI